MTQLCQDNYVERCQTYSSSDSDVIFFSNTHANIQIDSLLFEWIQYRDLLSRMLTFTFEMHVKSWVLTWCLYVNWPLDHKIIRRVNGVYSIGIFDWNPTCPLNLYIAHQLFCAVVKCCNHSMAASTHDAGSSKHIWPCSWTANKEPLNLCRRTDKLEFHYSKATAHRVSPFLIY